MTPEPTGVTLLVTGGDVVTMNATRDVLVGGAVAIADGRVAAVGSTAALRAAHPDAAELDASGCVVTPGLVDAHQHHTGDALVRSSIPDDLPPGESIFEWAVPLHAAHTGDDDELASLLTCVESLRAGVTTVVEPGTVAHPDRVAAVCGDILDHYTAKVAPLGTVSATTSSAVGRSSDQLSRHSSHSVSSCGGSCAYRTPDLSCPNRSTGLPCRS